LLVDESQDLNRCQQELAKKAGKRLVFCGDPKQAIYGFAGADAKSMERLQEELQATPEGCVVLPLTVTRRCGKAIVTEANKYVPDFSAHENNPEGKVSKAKYQSANDKGTYHEQCEAGDMIVCRVNAPLVSQCFKFLRQNRKANIQGRDIGQGLIRTIQKLKASDVTDLCMKLQDWLHAEVKKENIKKQPSEARIANIQDKYDCLTTFAEEANTIEEVIERIETIFTDNAVNSILLSSVHKAKGLEAQRVFLLQPKGATIPHPMARTKQQKEQEYNLLYVAITRAISELVYVS